MYSVMAIFSSSIVREMFEYNEFFVAPQRKKSGGERSRDLGGQRVLEMILSANMSSKSAIDMCCMSRSTILLKVGLVNFIFFQLCNEGIHNIVTVPLGVESFREKIGPTMRLRDIPTQTPIFSSCSGDSWNTWGLCAHQTLEF
jgi:hypothetical protein